MLAIVALLLFFQVPSAAEVQRESLPSWQQYRVGEIYRGRPAIVVFTNKEEREYRTQIIRQAAKGPNFAGHYTVVTWGCGTECTRYVIVDARAGGVFFHTQQESACAVDYKLDSRLMITDERCTDAGHPTFLRSFWDWNGTVMTLIKKIPVAFKTGSPRDFPASAQDGQAH